MKHCGKRCGNVAVKVAQLTSLHNVVNVDGSQFYATGGNSHNISHEAGPSRVLVVRTCSAGHVVHWRRLDNRWRQRAAEFPVWEECWEFCVCGWVCVATECVDVVVAGLILRAEKTRFRLLMLEELNTS